MTHFLRDHFQEALSLFRHTSLLMRNDTTDDTNQTIFITLITRKLHLIGTIKKSRLGLMSDP